MNAVQAVVALAFGGHSEELLSLPMQRLSPPIPLDPECHTVPDGGPTHLLKMLFTIHVYGVQCHSQGCVQHAMIQSGSLFSPTFSPGVTEILQTQWE